MPYRCSCGKEFDEPMGRTLHMRTCPVMTTPSDDKPKEWWICQTPGYDGDAYDTDPATWSPPKNLEHGGYRKKYHVIERAALTAAEAEIANINEAMRIQGVCFAGVRSQKDEAEASIKQLNTECLIRGNNIDDLVANSIKAERLRDEAIEKYGALVMKHCDAADEIVRLGNVIAMLNRQSDESKEEAEREIAEQKELVKDACAGRDQWRKTQVEKARLTKENAELNETCMRMANERLDVEWPLVQEKLALTKQNEEQAKEIELLRGQLVIRKHDKLLQRLADLDGVAAVNLAEPSDGDLERITKAYAIERARLLAANEIIQALEAALMHIAEANNNNSAHHDAVAALTKLAEYRKLSDT